MSTNDESDRYEPANRRRLPPEWYLRPEPECLPVVVCAPPSRHRWARRALRRHAKQFVFLRWLEEVAGDRAQGHTRVLLVSHELLAGESREARRKMVPGWLGEPDTIVVVIDAPPREGLSYLGLGADIAVGPEVTALELSARIDALLRRARTERDRNPLTGLAGNRRLRRYLKAMLADGQTVSLIVADIDDFKGYNDRHGHLAGDELILLVADVLREAAEPRGGAVAHVGGDDFCVVCAPDAAEGVARHTAREFQRRRAQLPADGCPSITIVSVTVGPEEADALQDVFERLAARRQAAREGRGANDIR